MLPLLTLYVESEIVIGAATAVVRPADGVYWSWTLTLVPRLSAFRPLTCTAVAPLPPPAMTSTSFFAPFTDAAPSRPTPAVPAGTTVTMLPVIAPYQEYSQ